MSTTSIGETSQPPPQPPTSSIAKNLADEPAEEEDDSPAGRALRSYLDIVHKGALAPLGRRACLEFSIEMKKMNEESREEGVKDGEDADDDLD